MGQVILPHPDGDLRVDITLELVARLEEGESLLALAEKLVTRQLKMTEAVAVLKTVYRHAGVVVPPDDFITLQSPHLLLAKLLTAIIAPLSALGATGKQRGDAA